jgi:hypothetical protein
MPPSKTETPGDAFTVAKRKALKKKVPLSQRGIPAFRIQSPAPYGRHCSPNERQLPGHHGHRHGCWSYRPFDRGLRALDEARHRRQAVGSGWLDAPWRKVEPKIGKSCGSDT